MNKKENLCKECGELFIPSQWNQIYCGSKSNKFGCSYKKHLERIKNFNLVQNREWMKEYQRKWRIKQRSEKTEYAKRQLESKRLYGNSLRGKTVSNEWRRKNLQKILMWNRKRTLLKKGALGGHSEEEWMNLKIKHNFCCAICGISEDELKMKWNIKGFGTLTRDHIIHLSKGGEDNIKNIRPLCISCNTKKKDEEVIEWLK